MKRVLFTLFVILLYINTINALENCTPSDEYLKYMALSDDEKKNYIEPPYCKELMEDKTDDNFLVSFFKTLTNTITAASTDSSYNAVDHGLISTPEDQGNLGTCWAFSSVSSVEANARKNNLGSYNFSESHMIYSVLSGAYSDSEGQKNKYTTNGFNGGKVTYAASYYFNNYGQLLESDWRYSDYGTKITSSNYKKGNKLISLGGFSYANLGGYSSCNSEEINYIKNQIINYGSVQASMYMDESLFKDSSKNYYISSTSNSSLPNHGISIVGWDDNVSDTKFSSSRKGAFIVKNTWGSTWSDDGYFYISYDDNFICKNTATFYDVSNKTFENTYAAADMVGIPTFKFTSTFYTSAKFTKKTSNKENLERVSFPIGENSTYYVYLVPDNNLYSTSKWQLLDYGETETYGIKSVDLSNKVINDDFTIVVKYVPKLESGIFTMCTNIPDTSNMTISSNTNYYATTTSNWADMSNIAVGSSNLSCEPNIYAYTNSVSSTTQQSIVINSITSSSNNYVVSFTNSNVSTSAISYMISDSNNNNVTSHFTIVPNYSTNKITISSDGTMSGKFNFIIKYNGKEATTTFTLSENISTKDSSFISINDNNLMVSISNNYTLTYQKLINGLNISNSSFQVLNANGNVVNSSSTAIGTNAKLKLNDKSYLIVVNGDVNGDGKISALDYIEVRKHIMGSKITNIGQLEASDLDKNGRITALDYISIRMILMR